MLRSNQKDKVLFVITLIGALLTAHALFLVYLILEQDMRVSLRFMTLELYLGAGCVLYSYIQS